MENPDNKARDRDKDRILVKMDAAEPDDLKILGNDEEDENLRKLVDSSFEGSINPKFKIAVKAYKPTFNEVECAVAVAAIHLRATITVEVEEDVEEEVSDNQKDVEKLDGLTPEEEEESAMPSMAILKSGKNVRKKRKLRNEEKTKLLCRWLMKEDDNDLPEEDRTEPPKIRRKRKMKQTVIRKKMVTKKDIQRDFYLKNLRKSE